VPPDRRQAILDAAIAVIARRGVRGLRVEQVAEEAGVAVSLIYYYFANRAGLVRATLDHANDRVGIKSGDSVSEILLAELEESAHDTSVVWGEVLASAVFEPALRDGLREASESWTDLVEQAVGSRDAAERLTALVDGLSARWLAGLITRARARELLVGAIAAEQR
jgi:AcrR family transcriptional regulator